MKVSYLFYFVVKVAILSNSTSLIGIFKYSILISALIASYRYDAFSQESIFQTLSFMIDGKWEQEEYNDEVYKPNPKKTPNESLMDNIEKASYAANNNLKLSFIYMQYGPTPTDGIQLQEKHPTSKEKRK